MLTRSDPLTLQGERGPNIAQHNYCFMIKVSWPVDLSLLSMSNLDLQNGLDQIRIDLFTAGIRWSWIVCGE
jgi:hypothetical protein